MADDVTIYYITGKQLGPLSIPTSWCEECDLTVRAVKDVLLELDPGGSLSFSARPWIRYALEALARGGWHAPVLMIEGSVFSQGVVPEKDALRRRLVALLGSRSLPAGEV